MVKKYTGNIMTKNNSKIKRVSELENTEKDFEKHEKDVSYLETLESTGTNLFIYDKGLKITIDPLFLASCVKKILQKDKKIKNKTMLDIGAGQGILGFLLIDLNLKQIDSLEIQNSIYEILEHNILNFNNSLQAKEKTKLTSILGDIKNYNYKYDYIISNPPYRKVESGYRSSDEIERNSKFEELLTLSELIKSIYRNLVNFGEFFVVIPNDRLNDLLKYVYNNNNMRVCNLFIKNLKKKKLVVVHGAKGGKFNSDIQIYIE